MTTFTCPFRDMNGTSVLMTAVVRGDNEMAHFLLNRLVSFSFLLVNILYWETISINEVIGTWLTKFGQ